MSALLARLNEGAKARVLTLQEYFVLAAKSLRFVFARPFYGQDVVQQMDEIGVRSLGIVLLTGLFTGMVLALQSSVQLKTFGATMYIGNLVSASMIRELGPVLAGLMVAGRVGSGIAAQLGSMRVTEQIDALNTLGTDPIKKLVTPRVLAALIMLPVLTVINDFVGIIGGTSSPRSSSGFRRRSTGALSGIKSPPTGSRCATSRTISCRDYRSRSCSAASSRSPRATSA